MTVETYHRKKKENMAAKHRKIAQVTENITQGIGGDSMQGVQTTE